MNIYLLALLACSVIATASGQAERHVGNSWTKVFSLVEPLVEPLLRGIGLSTSGPFAPVTPQILEKYIEPINVRTSVLGSNRGQSDTKVRSNSFATAM